MEKLNYTNKGERTMEKLNNETVLINGKEVEKTKLRKALSAWEYIYNKLQSSDNKLPLKEIFRHSEITEAQQTEQPAWFIFEENSNFLVIFEQHQTFVGYRIAKDFTLALNDKEHTVITVNYDEAWTILGDMLFDAQEDFLRRLDLTPLNTYISRLLGIPVEFKKSISYNQRNERIEMGLTTAELVQHSGIMQANFKSLISSTFGTAYFYIDKTGTQKLAFPPIDFSYQHKDGGSNGSSITDIWYDIDTNKWSGRAVGTNDIVELN